MAHKKCKEMLQPVNSHQFRIHIRDIECDKYELRDKFPKHWHLHIHVIDRNKQTTIQTIINATKLQ